MPSIATSIEGSIPTTHGNSASLLVGVIYTTDDPYALCFNFHVEAEECVPWTISIELFEHAFDHPGYAIGHNAIVTLHHGAGGANSTISLQLCAPEGNGTITLPAEDVRIFIEHARELATDDVKEDALDAMLSKIATFLQEQ